MEVILAKPRGFCAGVNRAIETVKLTIERHKPPVYVLHEIVHNRHVIEGLRNRGATFVESLSEIPEGSLTVFSAHGVADKVVEEAVSRNLKVIDATCPLVTKVHYEARKYSEQGLDVIIIGHPGHPEVEGTLGRVPGPVRVLSTASEVYDLEVKEPGRMAFVTQTTLSMDDCSDVTAALKERFPGIKGAELRDICYATQNRQNAVRRLSREIDLLLVVGSRNSSNSNRLREVGSHHGIPSYLVDDASDVKPEWLNGIRKIGLTAGASAPEEVLQGVLGRLREYSDIAVREMEGQEESVRFRLPASMYI
ncbi:MAG TPA: 4-hydroxy-3-methylbut-2-enyl diphosphate reductase [Thermodesulfobacteriaceae bacterium]|nr:4-hydroxy-3-methylbut-2-enyl diphosphate reductase [Thermodesulfobacteriaceae bacterium]